MGSGEWRYGQGDEAKPWTTDASRGDGAGAPNLWGDEPASAWGSTASWQSPPPWQSTPTPEPADDRREDSREWYRQPDTGEWGSARHAGPASPGQPPAPALPTVPERSASPGPTVGSTPVSRGSRVRTGVDGWARPEPTPRRRAVDTDEFRPERRPDRYGDEPAYGPVLGYTAGWYAVPAVFYFVWLITLDTERKSFAWREFVASLPWLFAAVVLSIAIAALLRWAVVGWRALTLSFAAAVIGAGVATIAHSLTL